MLQGDTSMMDMRGRHSARPHKLPYNVRVLFHELLALIPHRISYYSPSCRKYFGSRKLTSICQWSIQRIIAYSESKVSTAFPILKQINATFVKLSKCCSSQLITRRKINDGIMKPMLSIKSWRNCVYWNPNDTRHV